MSIQKLKKSLKEDKLVYGLRSAVKNLKNGKVSMIFLSDSCPDKFKDQVKGYDGVEIIELKEPSKELALICKKKFLVNIVSAVKK